MLPDVPQYHELQVDFPWWTNTGIFLLCGVMTLLLCAVFHASLQPSWGKLCGICSAWLLVWAALTIYPNIMFRRRAFTLRLLRYSPANLYLAAQSDQYTEETKNEIHRLLRKLGHPLF